MLRASQSGKRGGIWATAIAVLGIGILAAPARAGVAISFDPDGTRAGGQGTQSVVSFDEDPGNALLVGALAGGEAVQGRSFTTLYQAKITSLKAPDPLSASQDIGIFNYGAAGNVFGELTIVARFFEVLTNITVNSRGDVTGALSLAPDQTGSFFRIYYDGVNGANGNSNNLLGTGFTDGTLIYNGGVLPNGQVGSFTNQRSTNPTAAGTPIGSPPVPLPGNAGTPVALDQFGTNNYTNIRTVAGSGGTNLSVLTSPTTGLPLGYNPNFFKTDISNYIFSFNSSVKLAFTQTQPAAKLFDGTGAAGLPNSVTLPAGYTATNTIGSINGASGPNELLQADANSSFEAPLLPTPGPLPVPEPGTFSLGLAGVGLSSLAALHRRLRARTAA
jgi:hypothetical protein